MADPREELIRNLARQQVSRADVLKRGLKFGLSAAAVAAIIGEADVALNLREASAASLRMPNSPVPTQSGWRMCALRA